MPAQLIRPVTNQSKGDVVFGIGPQQPIRQQQPRPANQQQQQPFNVAAIFPANLNGNPSLPQFSFLPTSKPTTGQLNSKPKTNQNGGGSKTKPASQQPKPGNNKSSGKNPRPPQSTLAPSQFIQPLYLRPNEQSGSLSVPAPIPLPKLPGSPVSIPVLKTVNTQPPPTTMFLPASLAPSTVAPLPTPIQEPAVGFLSAAEQPADPTTPLPVVTVTPESIVWSAVGETEVNLIPIGTEAPVIEMTEPPTTFSPSSIELRPVDAAPEVSPQAVPIETTTTPRPNRITTKSKFPKPNSRPNPKLRPYTRPVTSTTTVSPFESSGETSTTTRKPYYTRIPSKDRLKSYSKQKQIESSTQTSTVNLLPKRPAAIESNSLGESRANRTTVADVKVTTESVSSVDTLDVSRIPEVTTQSRIQVATESSVSSEPSVVTEIFKETTSAVNNKIPSVNKFSGPSPKPSYQSQTSVSQSFFNFGPSDSTTTSKPPTVLKVLPSGNQEKPSRIPSWSVESPVSESRPSINQAKPVNKPPVVETLKPVGSIPAASAPSSTVHKNNDESYDDEIDGDYSAIPGQPGVDYPIFSDVPNTPFNCSQQRLPGYYADPSARCQLFHVCHDDRQWSFLCPNGTVFSQHHFVCVWWYEFDCSQATSLYSMNERLYQVQSIPEGDYVKSEVSGGNKYIGKRDALEEIEEQEDVV